MTEQPHVPAGQPKQKRGWVKPTLLTVGGLAVLGTVVSALAGDPAEHDHDHGPVPTHTVTAQPEPAPTVTETAEPEVVTETVTETVVVAPESCLQAIALGDELDTVYRKIGGVLVSYIEIIQSLDAYGYTSNEDLIKFEETVRANEEINAERDAVYAEFVEKAIECEAASGDDA